MRLWKTILSVPGIMLLCGCAAPEVPPPEEENRETMLHLGDGLKPESLQFPEYLLMIDFEIDQHGRIPQSTVIGAGLKTALDLTETLRRFNEVLAAHGWSITKREVAGHYFLMQALKGVEQLEIRAVQGTGPTEIFLLYQPEPGPLL